MEQEDNFKTPGLVAHLFDSLIFLDHCNSVLVGVLHLWHRIIQLLLYSEFKHLCQNSLLIIILRRGKIILISYSSHLTEGIWSHHVYLSGGLVY